MKIYDAIALADKSEELLEVMGASPAELQITAIDSEGIRGSISIRILPGEFEEQYKSIQTAISQISIRARQAARRGLGI